jgi:flagellar protein FlaJ
MENLPFKFLPMTTETAIRASRIFLPIGSALAKTNPSIKSDLAQLSIKISPEEYMSMVIFSAFFSFITLFIPVFVIGILLRPLQEVLPVSLLGSLSIAIIVAFYSIVYTKLEVIRKTKLLEKDLLFVLRYIYIKIKSGIPLYDAMVGVAYGDFGEISKEFKKTIKEVSAGIDELRALENMALRNPSLYFRRVVWQITNNMRAGVDIADVLGEITSSLVKEHKLLVRKYGSELNPIILMYMMFTVVIPSLGITVIVVMSAFSGIAVPLYLFYIIPIIVFALQLVFISLIKNKRPLMVI